MNLELFAGWTFTPFEKLTILGFLAFLLVGTIFSIFMLVDAIKRHEWPIGHSKVVWILALTLPIFGFGPMIPVIAFVYHYTVRKPMRINSSQSIDLQQPTPTSEYNSVQSSGTSFPVQKTSDDINSQI